RARTETFGTSVALERILERAAPASTAVTQDGAPRNVHDGATNTDGPSPARDDLSAHPGPPPIQLPGRMPPSGSLLVIAALGAFGLGAAAIYVFYQGRGAVLRPDAMLLEPDAAPANAAPSLPADAASALDADEPAPDSTEIVRPTTSDARPLEARHDAGVRPPLPDAGDPGELTTPIDSINSGASRPTGTATLTIGANPWGTVLLDGKPIGRTPIDHLSVPAGHHMVSVTFGGEDPPRTLSYPIDLANGEAKDLLADFTRTAPP
ncbi:MAG TPA: PEGA domain-containing protein, partial [Kofleriaceae bacterium]|nr:PEGA domain-containing protein [Kofleriaceae bacterium]